MSFESELRTYVIADSAVSAAVGTRMHYQIAPQGSVYPLIEYETEEEFPDQVISGFTGMDRIKILVTCWAETASSALTLAGAMRSRIGQMIHVTLSTLYVDRSLTEEGRSTIEPWPGQSKARRFGFMQPFTFWVATSYS